MLIWLVPWQPQRFVPATLGAATLSEQTAASTAPADQAQASATIQESAP